MPESELFVVAPEAWVVARAIEAKRRSPPPGDLSARPVEERSPEEVTHTSGVRLAPEGVSVYNPAFDVTPAEYVTAIITNRGVARPPFGERNAYAAPFCEKQPSMPTP